MQFKTKDNLIFLRLFPGEEIYPCLKQTCQKCRVETGVVLSGLGQLADFELGFFKEKGDYLPQRFSKPYELLSLAGIVSKEKRGWQFHLHAVLSDERKEVKGGHLIAGRVNVTAEIVLLKTNLKIFRRTEPKTGLSGMFLEI